MIQSLLSVGGLRDGSLFRAAPWVDRGKPPGATPQPQSWRSWLRGTLSLSFIVHSPNLVWLLIAAAVYCAAPYDVPGLTDSHAGCRKGKSRLNRRHENDGIYEGWRSSQSVRSHSRKIPFCSGALHSAM